MPEKECVNDKKTKCVRKLNDDGFISAFYRNFWKIIYVSWHVERAEEVLLPTKETY